MNTFKTVDFVCSKRSAFSDLADVVGLSVVIKCPLSNKVFLEFSFFFLNKERRKGAVYIKKIKSKEKIFQDFFFIFILKLMD